MDNEVNPKKVWLDTDPAIGVKFRDIDDGLAILLLLASPEVNIEGISINFGNVNANMGIRIATEVISVAGADVPLFIGARSRRELGKPNPAVEAMIDRVKKYPGQISLLAVAPLTNVATAMILDETFARNLRELVVMGGALNFRPFSWFGEFNFHMDGRAAARVISAPIPKTVLTMDLCSQAVFRREHLEQIKKVDSPVARYLAEHIPHWLNLNRKIFRKGGFFPWDPVAAAYLIDGSLFDENNCSFSVVEEGMRRGRIIDFLTISEEGFETITPAINMPRRMDDGRFMDLLINRLTYL